MYYVTFEAGWEVYFPIGRLDEMPVDQSPTYVAPRLVLSYVSTLRGELKE